MRINSLNLQSDSRCHCVLVVCLVKVWLIGLHMVAIGVLIVQRVAFCWVRVSVSRLYLLGVYSVSVYSECL